MQTLIFLRIMMDISVLSKKLIFFFLEGLQQARVLMR